MFKKNFLKNKQILIKKKLQKKILLYKKKILKHKFLAFATLVLGMKTLDTII